MEGSLRRLGKARVRPRHFTSSVPRRRLRDNDRLNNSKIRLLIFLTDKFRSVHWKLQSRVNSALFFALSSLVPGLITCLSRLGLGAVIPSPPPPPSTTSIRKLKRIIYASKWSKQESIPAASALVFDTSRFA